MEKHDLLHEFPEYQEAIHVLKISNSHFKKLFDDYDALEHRIHRVNVGIEIMSDEAFKELKTKMLILKDKIYSLLKS
ncbi:MAG: DUF465 domain-containing protein [Bacteroidota bacterium]